MQQIMHSFTISYSFIWMYSMIDLCCHELPVFPYSPL